jgi:uncharacterized protein YkwD
MSWIRSMVVISTVGCLIILPPSQALAGGAERSVVNRINQIRGANGLRPLRVSASLNGSSRAYLRLMQRQRYFGHSSRIRMSRRFHKRGEVLGQHGGRRPLPGAAVGQWMASPLHRALLLDGGFRYIGVSSGYGSFGGRAVMGWVAQLGS